jgi:uncharacterized OB-fold protein
VSIVLAVSLTPVSGTEGRARPPSPRFDLPIIEAESAPYWSALREGRLLLRRCRACGAHHHYPRPFCPACWSDDVEWVEAAGGGTLYTHSTVYVNDLPPFGPQVPYTAAVVELDEGPRLMTRVVDCAPEALAIGMRVELRTEPVTDEVTMAVFAPAAD